MAKNILLLFLSPVKPNDDIKFVNIDGKGIKNSNEPAILYLAQKNIALDKIFIFASEMIRQPVANYLEDDEPITHLNFFLKRLEEFLPGVDSFIFNYDEKISDDAKLKSVAEMANKIQEYAGGEETFLHVDLTGGMRDINMMMLDLTRLLEYSGLKIGTLVYSDLGKKKVEELRNIYDLFQLIAGVEEFVNFGSVTALKNYYADKKLSEPLTNLLAAMENFAEAIKLCHYGQFHDAIINLHDAVRDFKPAQDDTQDILMARLIGRIREDYHRLIVNRDLDDLEVIRWCLEKGYLQQALTLYTERIPEYLVEKKLITMRNDVREKLKDTLGNDLRSVNFYLLNVYKSEDKDFQTLGNLVRGSLDKAQQKDYAALIKNISDAVKNNRDFAEWYAQLDKLAEKICKLIKLVEPDAPIAKEHIVCADVEKLRAQYEIFARVAANEFENLPLDTLKEFFDKLKPKLDGAPPAKKRKIILNALAQLNVNEIKDYFPPLVSKRNAQIFRLKMMLDAQIFSLNFDAATFFNVMEKYFRIKTERNQSNHAREDEGEFKSAQELRDFMFSGINELDAVLNN